MYYFFVFFVCRLCFCFSPFNFFYLRINCFFVICLVWTYKDMDVHMERYIYIPIDIYSVYAHIYIYIYFLSNFNLLFLLLFCFDYFCVCVHKQWFMLIVFLFSCRHNHIFRFICIDHHWSSFWFSNKQHYLSISFHMHLLIFIQVFFSRTVLV